MLEYARALPLSQVQYEIVRPAILKGQTIGNLMSCIKVYPAIAKALHPPTEITDFSRWLLQLWLLNKKDDFWATALSPTTRLASFSNDRKDLVLPYDEVTIDGRPVLIHGIIHGRGSKTNPRFVDTVGNYIRYTLDNGQPWYVKEGLKKEFGLPADCRELHDAATLKQAQQFREKFRNKKPDTKALRLWKNVLIFAMLKITPDQDQYLNYYNFMGHLLDRFQANLHVLTLIERFIEEARFPEPLDMEIGLTAPLGSAAELSNTLDPVIHRSIYQARELRRLSCNQTNNTRPIHILTGVQNQTQIAYLLAHPSYNPMRSVLMTQKQST